MLFFLIFTLFIILLLVLAIFLSKELLKKFLYFKNFSEGSQFMIHQSLVSDTSGMVNIVFRSSEPFTILIGFRLTIPVLGYEGFDYYGCAMSDTNNQLIISTYLHKNRLVEFQFMKNTLNEVIVTSTESDQKLLPNISYPPHWWQRLDFLNW